MGERTFRRYTNLAAAIHLLRTRRITLLDPETWQDKNDSYFLARYKERIGAGSVLAACFADAAETFHHWSVFASRSNGVCVQFNKEILQAAVGKDKSVEFRQVRYLEIKTLKTNPIVERDLPFVKRYPYKDEREYRLLHINRNSEIDFYHVRIPLTAIDRITLSPWMPQSLAEEVKPILKSIKGCGQIEIYRSTLIENENWKNAARSAR